MSKSTVSAESLPNVLNKDISKKIANLSLKWQSLKQIYKLIFLYISIQGSKAKPTCGSHSWQSEKFPI